MKLHSVLGNEQSMTSASLLDRIAELRESGVDGYDPVRFRYIEALAGRAHSAREAVSQRLADKADNALQAYLQASCQPCPKDKQASSRPPNSTVVALAALRRDVAASQLAAPSGTSDFEQELQDQEGELLQDGLYAPSLTSASESLSVADGGELPAPPLKASQTMRVHQQRRAAEKRIELAIAEGPESPGPLNPQMLAIKSLTIMRDISPQYLNRYVAYLDTLFWVEQLDTAASNKTDKKNSRVGSRAKPKKKSV